MTHKERELNRLALVRHVKAGGKVEEVAAQYGLNPVYAAAICRAADVYGTAYKQVPNMKSFEILKALLDGERPVEIARKYRLSRQRIDQIGDRARAAGFKLPKCGT